MNRRRYTRQPISLSALVHPEQGRSWLCTIRDFCEDGMLLTGSGGSRSLLATGSHIRAGDEVALHFSVATPSGQQHYRAKAKVARLQEAGNGMGVQFDGAMPEEAFGNLIEFAVASGTLSRQGDEAEEQAPVEASADAAVADAQPAGDAAAAKPLPQREPSGTSGQPDVAEELLRDRRINKADADKIRKRLHEVTAASLDELCVEFFGRVDQDLLVHARDAGTNAVQMMYFEGMDLLDKNRQQAREDFISDVLRQIDTISELDDVLERRRRRETGDATQLEIVDTDQFEDWLAVAEVISRAENRFGDALLDLRSQLGLVAKPWSHKDVVPVGPAVLVWAFDDALGGLAFRRQVKEDVYRCFERVMLEFLGMFYQRLGEALEETGVFPSVDELRASLQHRAVRRTRSGVRVEPQAYQEMDVAVREAAMAADGVAPAAARVDYNPFLETLGGAQGLYSAARNILGLNRRTREMMGQGREALVAAPDARPEETFKSEDILQALSSVERQLEDSGDSDVRLKPRLIEILRRRHGDAKTFKEQDYDTLEVMENLVDALRTDSFLTHGVREWIARLEITLNKLAAQDPEFLNSESERPHSAVQMLNQLARLGDASDVREGIDREVGRRVDELLKRVVQEYDGNPDVFSEVVGELGPLVDRQTRAYRGNIERTVRASEGQQKLARARRAVIDEMTERLAGKQVPDLMLELLNPGWRNLLVHTHLRNGPQSNGWQDQLAVIDQLWDQLEDRIEVDSEAYVNPDALLKRVVEGLNSISFDPSKRTPLIMNLSAALVGDTMGKRAELTFSVVEPSGVAAALGLEGMLHEPEAELETDDEDLQQSWSRAVDRARRIQVGEWLATSDAQGRPLILSVAFVGDDSTNFVLVNRKGVRVRELMLKEVADGLHDGHITLLDDFDLPLMERASQRMLENMHSQLAYQSSHDDLTQLLNRREFERLVEQAIVEAKAKDQQHGLLYLDLDQFKIVNNTSGHTAGDELLKLIADALSKALADMDMEATVARLGGDEFGVLVEDIETSSARELAEELLNAVRGQRFEWDGRHYTLSASMGLVFLDQTTKDVDIAMQYADEACYRAKDAGRNRLQEYELGDSVMMQRHGAMEWVTQLDKALEEDRLILNCQRISPINRRPTPSEHHYEILLTMLDELGDTMPPGEFIVAAETYNRMTTIDRWVIEQVLGWMSDHKDRLDSFAGFAINVSGHSVNDETFPDFVLEQFAKTQAPTGKVCFEITETAAIANLDNAVDFMNRMKIIGCKFSLDDFGTGLSSYSYLRNLPVDFVKIDGVFVKDIADNPGDYAVVRSINEIGHYMGKRTIAEYVETNDILERLREIGVDYAQGFQIEKPRPLAELRP